MYLFEGKIMLIWSFIPLYWDFQLFTHMLYSSFNTIHACHSHANTRFNHLFHVDTMLIPGWWYSPTFHFLIFFSDVNTRFNYLFHVDTLLIRCWYTSMLILICRCCYSLTNISLSHNISVSHFLRTRFTHALMHAWYSHANTRFNLLFHVDTMFIPVCWYSFTDVDIH